jgi:hypothetical protein
MGEWKTVYMGGGGSEGDPLPLALLLSSVPPPPLLPFLLLLLLSLALLLHLPSLARSQTPPLLPLHLPGMPSLAR